MPDMMLSSLEHAAAQAPLWLQNMMTRGREAWQAADLPTRKTESWKYTSLDALQDDFVPAEPSAATLQGLGVELPELGGCQLVYVDGHFRGDLSSSTWPEGVSVVRFKDADDEQSEQIRTQLGSAVEHSRHLFAALNDAALADGVFLNIDKDTRVEAPLHLVWINTVQEQSFSINQRLLLTLGSNSQASLIEHFVSAGGSGSAFTNGITELLVARGATLDHYRLHLEETAAMHIGGVHTRLAADATLNGFHLALGSKLKRLDIVVHHDGPGAHCDLNGIYLPRGSQHIDYQTCIEHAAPHCTSNETFRGIIGDQARAVFNGRIHIHPDAQKTRAELSNKNLLTSAGAEINTKPELEIYADDVQCAHGATVAQLDELSLYYMRSRGISRSEAEVILSFGFVNEVVDTVRCKPLHDYLRPLLAHRFSRDPALTRHLV